MRWLYFLLVSPALSQTRDVKPLRFDFTALPATRDSFVYFVDHTARGFAVWQYEHRSLENGQRVVYTQYSQLEPVEEEETRVELDRLTGEPITSVYHLDLFTPASDTLVLEHDLTIKQGGVEGRRRVKTKDGRIQTASVHRPLPRGTVWLQYELYAAAVTNAAPGDSLACSAYDEAKDSLTTLTFVAGQPTTIKVPAGRFDVLPLRSGALRLYVTRTAPRRVVKGETPDGRFSFELTSSAPVVPSQP
jgi:hypothetical protein